VKRRWVLTASAAVLLAAATGFAGGLGQKLADSVGSSNPGLISYSATKEESRCLGGEFVPRSSLPATLETVSLQDWAAIEAQPGAAAAGQSVVRVSIQGESDRTVTLTGISFRVKRGVEPSGAVFSGQCGGPFVGRAIEVDLDLHPPRVVDSVAGLHGMLGSRGLHGERLYQQIRFPWTVSLTDPLLLDVVATTESCYCHWSAEIPWVSGAQKGVIHIDDEGSPLAVTGAVELPAYVPSASGWKRFPASS
jgi:hypothetical protein